MMTEPITPESLGCSDHGCIFGHPGGQGTNGGCHCLEGVRHPIERARLREKILAIWKQRDEARAEVDRLETALEIAQDQRDEARAALAAVAFDPVEAWEGKKVPMCRWCGKFGQGKHEEDCKVHAALGKRGGDQAARPGEED